MRERELVVLPPKSVRYLHAKAKWRVFERELAYLETWTIVEHVEDGEALDSIPVSRGRVRKRVRHWWTPTLTRRRRDIRRRRVPNSSPPKKLMRPTASYRLARNSYGLQARREKRQAREEFRDCLWLREAMGKCKRC